MKARKNQKTKEAQKTAQRKNIFLFLSILAVVAVSGCIVPGGDVFAGMFSPQRPATTEGSADLITTQNVNIIPNPPISAENTFTVSFEVKNNDENEEVKNVKVTQYDSGLCKSGKTTTPDSGGVAESDIVKALPRTKIISLKAHCQGKTDDSNDDEVFYLEDGVEKSVKVCDNSIAYKASDKDSTITLLKDKTSIKTVGMEGKTTTNLEYVKFSMEAGKIWDCLEEKYGDDKYKNNCILGKDLTEKYTLVSVEFKDRAQCLGKSQCFRTEDDCSKDAERQNTDCKGSAEKKVGCYAKYGPGGSVKEDSDLLTACNNRCDKYEVQQSETAPCNPLIESGGKILGNSFDVYGDYDGVCCAYDIVSQTIDTSVSTATTSTTVAGAKTYYPLQTELTEWDFTAPKNSQIGNMPRACGIKYKINYDFSAKTQTDVTVISKNKMEEMQRAGQEPSASPQQSVGVGPIKVFFDFGAKQPIKSGDILPIFITVEDRGSGLLEKGNVLTGKLKIKFPPTFEKLTCDKFTSKGGGEYANTAEIPMIKKSSPQMRCSFRMPSVTDMKTFYISATLDYTYKLDSEISVAVNPTLVR